MSLKKQAKNRSHFSIKVPQIFSFFNIRRYCPAIPE